MPNFRSKHIVNKWEYGYWSKYIDLLKKKNIDKYYAINLKGSIYAASNLGTMIILLR